jgi:23S rRNA (adenine-N6)-dimethyltransferase
VPGRRSRRVSAGRAADRQPRGPNPEGAHFLTDQALIARLVQASGVGPGDLAFDLGAGYGALTGRLARTGARVIAIERDPRLAGQLRRRFAGTAQVSVVEADLRVVPLPRRPFYVVASPPFALTTLLCRRLLGDPAVRVAGAELILEWGAARWLSASQPRDKEQACWAARYELRLVHRVPAACFSPEPASDAGYLRVRPRAGRASERPSTPFTRRASPARR